MSEGQRYEVAFEPAAIKELGRLDRPVARRIKRAVEGLAVDPRPASSTSLVGRPGLRRLRVGDYRVLYTIEDAELIVLALRVGHRSAVYRKR